MSLWNRAYKLQVGIKNEPPLDPETGRRAEGPVLEEVKLWTDLRIIFDISKNSDASPNTGKIQIWNLSPASRNFIRDNVKRKCQLEVGYRGTDESDLFGVLVKADIVDVKINKVKPDVVTILELGEAEEVLTNSRSNKVYKTGSMWKDLVLNKVSELGVNVSNSMKGFIDQSVTSALKSDYNANGAVKDVINVALKRFGLSWSVQNDEFIVNEYDNVTSITKLDLESGLIDEPEESEDGKMKFRSLLLPQIIPGHIIEFDTPNTRGFWKVVTAQYKGDSWQGDWTINGEVREV